MSGFRSMYRIFLLDICAWSAFYVALSSFSFPCILMWLGIQVRMMLLFLERVFILSGNLVMRGVDESLLYRAKRTDVEFE